MRLACVLWASLLCAQQHENLNSVVWMQTSAEYRAVAMQTYRAAEVNLQRALTDPNWTAALEQRPGFEKLPAAVILDVDETVVDNSAFQARLTAANKSFNDENWSAWVAERKAELIPGAREFLNTAHANGVAIFYVTNRTCDGKNADDHTLAVLRRHLLPKGELLCKNAPTDPSDKSPRRAYVARGHRVLLLIGDDFNDFVTVSKEQSTVEGRAVAVNAYSRYWGERWFMLPNPTYGSWERTVGYDVPRKRKSLRR